MDQKTIEQILYYVNQGGPGFLAVIIYGVYKGYQLATTFLAELQKTNSLLDTQNKLLSQIKEK